MRGARQFLQAHGRLALLLVALAFAMKALLPVGYMVAAKHQVITVTICADASGTNLTREIVIPRHSEAQDQSGHDAKGAACPFGALAMPAASGADPALLALALAFILVMGLARLSLPAPWTRAHSLPPLRGPPIPA